MDQPFWGYLASYWSPKALEVNLLIFTNLLGALLLGLLVGYERSYHGRAAGMRTYGLVCMASCAITVVVGYPAFWYGGGPIDAAHAHVLADPTRVIQGVVTGVGFLGAGVIMKEGLNISGLTTAASIWSSSAIGILVGLGFYSAAILLALLSAVLMMWASRLEQWLPSRPAVSVTLRFRAGASPDEEALRHMTLAQGYEMASGTVQIQFNQGRQEWRYVAIALPRNRMASLPALASQFSRVASIEEYQLSHARN